MNLANLTESQKWKDFVQKQGNFPGSKCTGCPYRSPGETRTEYVGGKWVCTHLIGGVNSVVLRNKRITDAFEIFNRSISPCDELPPVLGVASLLYHLNGIARAACQNPQIETNKIKE